MAFLGQFRGDLRSEWEAKNPVIHDREFILVKEDPDGPWTGYKIGELDEAQMKLLIPS